MSAAMLDSMLGEMVGSAVVAVRSSGFGPVDLPPIPDAVDAMKRRGLDVSAHRSSATTATLVDGADIILTAERAHVVKIAALSPAAFRRTATLPELLALASSSGLPERHDDVPGSSTTAPHERVAAWVEQLTSERRAADYLRAAVPEVADPTGWSPRAFEDAVRDIEQQCREVAVLLACSFPSVSR